MAIHRRIQNPEGMYAKKVIVIPQPAIALPGDCLVKVYEMFYEGKSEDTSSWIKYLERAVRNCFGNTELEFLINSDGMMNLSEWEQYISPANTHSNMILKNRILHLMKKILKATSRNLNAKEAGLYCQHELAIVAHERKAIINYIKSPNATPLKDWMDDTYSEEILY